MKTNNSMEKSTNQAIRRALAVPFIGLGLIALTSGAFADDGQGYSMAPPVQTSGGGTSTVSQDSVFNWSEVPQNQNVTLVRASFDQGGYQLYDSVGETIVVPFTNNNLYVMKFAQSTNGKMYFVNTGDAPVLYVPQNGYLTNATVDGARWYPFTKTFHPSTPVYVGIAPSWNMFIGMGWYPNMACWGGYWGPTPFIDGGVFVPCVGFGVDIGGAFLLGWGAYHNYWWHNPAQFHTAFWNHDVYGWASRPTGPAHAFAGSRGSMAHFSSHHFRGAGSGFGGDRGFGGGHGFGGGRGFGGGGGFFHRR